MIDVSKIDHCRIHPGIGIARLGNSLKEFFIGPEAPGEVANAGRTFKDASGRVKRQAARFRIYAFDAAGNAIDEVTLTDAKIEWQVHLANKKGAWFKFLGRFRSQKVLRNGAIQGGPEFQTNPDLRSELIIDPGARSIGGASQGPVTLDGGRFLGWKCRWASCAQTRRADFSYLAGLVTPTLHRTANRSRLSPTTTSGTTTLPTVR